MEKNRESWLTRQLMRPLWLIAFIAACVVATALIMRDCHGEGAELMDLDISHNTEIDLTPQQVRSIERIGQWEFLSIAEEELVDTTRHRLLSTDDQLARIYRGTLRIGLDLSRCREGWLFAHGDTVSATLPPIGLLSNNFIDEARTEAFYESGTWSARDKEALYQRAAMRMRARSLTSKNLRQAEENARAQISAMLRSFGFTTVELRFERQ